MKRTLAFLFTFFIILFAFAQKESIILKNVFEPNSVYEMSTKTQSYGTMKFAGDKDFEQLWKKSGQKLETVMNTNSEMIITATTFSKEGSSIPFVYSYDKVKQQSFINGEQIKSEKPTLEGLKVHGKITDGEISVDRFEGADLDDTTKKLFSVIVQQMAKGNNFPKNKLAVGDSFTQELPLNFPIENLGKLDLKVSVVYTLKSIENNMANFDLKHNLIMDTEGLKDYKLDAKGTGFGIMLYSLKDEIMTKMDSEMDMSMTFNIPDENITMTSINKNKTYYTNQKIK